MPPESTSGERESPADDAARDPRVVLFVRPGRNRELLVEALGGEYRVETTTDVAALEDGFDCCVFDTPEFNRVAGTIQSKRDPEKPVFLPFVLLVGENAPETTPEVWNYVDDVIDLPVRKAALLSRIRNLIERRQTSVQLARREAQLETAIEDLKLKERAMDAAPVGITIAETGDTDTPLVYANEQFERLTGYGSNIIGSDCRFLQGEETDPDTRATIRAALDAREPVSVDIRNYRKNGRKFWNKVDIAPIRDDEGTVTNFVGFQTDITERKIRERRLEVLNRVLSHNLRNKMNVIQGHAELLWGEYDGRPPASLATIRETAADLMGLAETASEIEQTLTTPESDAPVVDLREQVNQLLSGFADRFPAATFDLTAPDEPCSVAVPGIVTALEEAVENAVEHADTARPSVEVRITKRSDEWIDVEIEDDGPGIPAAELRVLERGETSLRHADRLGLWLMYWVITRVGGTFSVADAEPRGSVVTLSVPAHG
jgi:PAS domain S-box-containing protein